MNFAACLFALALAFPFQEPAPAGPDPKRIEAAVAELTAAFAKDVPPQGRAEVIAKCVDAVDARVIEWIAKGLQDKDARVVQAAVEALGRMPHPDALGALHLFVKREKRRLVEDDLLFPLVLKSIGRHGSPTSIDLLSDDPFSQRAFSTVQARILSLGNIRTRESIEALISMAQLVGPHRMEGSRNDFRIAFARLTGRDLGPAPEQWSAWWRDNKKGYEVAKEAPKIDVALQNQWDRYWGTGKSAKGGEDGGEGRGKGRKRPGEGGGEKQEGPRTFSVELAYPLPLTLDFPLHFGNGDARQTFSFRLGAP